MSATVNMEGNFLLFHLNPKNNGEETWSIWRVMLTYYKPILVILIQIARFYDYKVDLGITVHDVLYWLNKFLLTG